MKGQYARYMQRTHRKQFEDSMFLYEKALDTLTVAGTGVGADNKNKKVNFKTIPRFQFRSNTKTIRNEMLTKRSQSVINKNGALI